MNHFTNDPQTNCLCWLARLRQFAIDINLPQRLNKSENETIKEMASASRHEKLGRYLSDVEDAQMAYLIDNIQDALVEAMKEKLQEREQKNNDRTHRTPVTA